VLGTCDAFFYRLDALRDLRNQKYDVMTRSEDDVAEAQQQQLCERFNAEARRLAPRAAPGVVARRDVRAQPGGATPPHHLG
jgi:hypothetical protein